MNIFEKNPILFPPQLGFTFSPLFRDARGSMRERIDPASHFTCPAVAVYCPNILQMLFVFRLELGQSGFGDMSWLRNESMLQSAARVSQPAERVVRLALALVERSKEEEIRQ
jgi:hypothetical protein